MYMLATRFENLDRLIDEAGSVDELARRIKLAPQDLCRYSRRTRTIGDGMCALLEYVMSKPCGWMNCRHGPMCGHLIGATPAATQGATSVATKRATRRGTVVS